MKNMIERYVYDVVRRLPEDTREEVKKELYANIDDMLGSNRSDEHIEQILIELGEPRLLALKYQTKERYLISPAYYDDYIRVLKIVIIIFISISIVAGAIDVMINFANVTPWEMIEQVFSRLLGDAISSVFNSFAIVTLVFFLIERNEGKTTKRAWDVSRLPELPKQNVHKINRTGAVISLIIETILSVIFIMLLVNYIDYLGIYIDSELIAPIFNKEIVEAFIPILIASALFTISASILKVFYAAWDFKFTIFYTVSKIFSTVVTVFFINYANLFNTLMFDKIAEFANLTTVQVSNGFQTGINVFTVFICIAVSFDLIASWFKTLKNHKM